ncbi:ROK family protein [Nocardia sp. NPDC006044]|uniref:ROK family protein n=1 Tax=Nocardia sp. NPDC006044 TaxID=3364306 RepID=UPI0036BFFC3F
MTVLALEIAPTRFAAARVAADVDADDVRTSSIPIEAAWAKCRKLLEETAEGGEVESVGIACAWPVDMAAGVVAPPEVAEWQTGFGIVEAVQGLFPAATVHLAVDGVCLALAERNIGAAVGVMDSLSIGVSNRICGGITVGGFAVVGRTGNAGNIGHLPVPGFDDPCGCGSRGCLDAVAGGESAMHWARNLGWAGASVLELVASAQAGDPMAVAAVGRAGTALGRAIASAAALLDIDLAVLGGVMAEAGPALWEPLGAEAATYAQVSYLPGLRVVPSTLGDLGALAGAGLLAMSSQR